MTIHIHCLSKNNIYLYKKNIGGRCAHHSLREEIQRKIQGEIGEYCAHHSLREEIQRKIQGEIGEYCNRDVSGLAKFSGSCFGI